MYIRVIYMGNEDGFAVVKYGNACYYCNPDALQGNTLVVGQSYNVEYRELMARPKG